MACGAAAGAVATVCSGFFVSGSGFGFRILGSGFEVLVSGSGFWFGLRASGSGFGGRGRGSEFMSEFRVLGFGSGCPVRVSGLGFMFRVRIRLSDSVFGFRVRVSGSCFGFGFRISGFGFRVRVRGSGSGFGVLGRMPAACVHHDLSCIPAHMLQACGLESSHPPRPRTPNSAPCTPNKPQTCHFPGCESRNRSDFTQSNPRYGQVETCS